MIPCAFLRVFRPLETFSEEERIHWERFILAGDRSSPPRPVYREQSFAGGGYLGLIASDDGEDADVRLMSGRYFICPWRTRLRVLASILSLRQEAPFEMIDALVPDAEARRAARELARMRRREPTAVPSIQQSAWHVPIRWFVLVDGDERHLVEDECGGFRLYYWTPIGLARRRADRAIQALRRTELAPAVPVIRELAHWLGSFNPHSMVELDYASVSGLFTWDELDNDHSGREIQEAIASLEEEHRTARAVDLYQAVGARWAEARSRESLN